MLGDIGPRARCMQAKMHPTAEKTAGAIRLPGQYSGCFQGLSYC